MNGFTAGERQDYCLTIPVRVPGAKNERFACRETGWTPRFSEFDRYFVVQVRMPGEAREISFQMHSGPHQGRLMAFDVIYHLLQQQALLMSFSEILYGCAIIAAIAAAVGWLFRRVDGKGQG